MAIDLGWRITERSKSGVSHYFTATCKPTGICWTKCGLGEFGTSLKTLKSELEPSKRCKTCEKAAS